MSVLSCGLAAQLSLRYRWTKATPQIRLADRREENGEYIIFSSVICGTQADMEM